MCTKARKINLKSLKKINSDSEHMLIRSEFGNKKEICFANSWNILKTMNVAFLFRLQNGGHVYMHIASDCQSELTIKLVEYSHNVSP